MKKGTEVPSILAWYGLITHGRHFRIVFTENAETRVVTIYLLNHAYDYLRHFRYSTLKSQKTVTANLYSTQLLPFDFARRYSVP